MGAASSGGCCRGWRRVPATGRPAQQRLGRAGAIVQRLGRRSRPRTALVPRPASLPALLRSPCCVRAGRAPADCEAGLAGLVFPVPSPPSLSSWSKAVLPPSHHAAAAHHKRRPILMCPVLSSSQGQNLLDVQLKSGDSVTLRWSGEQRREGAQCCWLGALLLAGRPHTSPDRPIDRPTDRSPARTPCLFSGCAPRTWSVTLRLRIPVLSACSAPRLHNHRFPPAAWHAGRLAPVCCSLAFTLCPCHPSPSGRHARRVAPALCRMP